MARIRTHEQLQYADRLEALIRPVLGDRARLAVDGEGFPIVPGRLGQLEYLGVRSGADTDGAIPEERVYVFTDRRIISKLAAVPGVKRVQIGDAEARLALAAGDTAALRAVAKIISVRRRRAPTGGNLAVLTRARAQKARNRVEVVAAL